MKRNPAAGICMILTLLLLSCEPIETAGGGEDTTIPIESIYSIGKYTVEINFGRDVTITGSNSGTYTEIAACFTAYPKENIVAGRMTGKSGTLTGHRRLIITMESSSGATFLPEPDDLKWRLDFKQDDKSVITEGGTGGRKLESFYDRPITFNPEPLTAHIAGLTEGEKKLTLTFNRVLEDKSSESSTYPSGYNITADDFELFINGADTACTIDTSSDGSVFVIKWTAVELKSGDQVRIEFHSNNKVKDTLGQSLSSLSIANTL
jgi:hypothetical protein